MIIWLTGMMGAGKTTCGQIAAALVGVPFIDTDDEIAEAAGASIPDIWAREGEEGFRRREGEAIARIATLEAIVATGGGAVLDPRNREVMAGSGVVVWLDAPAGELARRLAGHSEGRPLLEGEDPPARLATLAAERDSDYRRAADHVIDTNGRHPSQIAEELAGLWRP